jgi:DNA-binding winged helix-turn-helix (wHTH) protein/tetratricopeptide (TPR) repeat protein
MRDPTGTRTIENRRRFGVFEFDGRTLELRKAGRLVAVRPQPLKLLALLLAHPTELVTRDELQRALWGDDTFVDFEQGVNHAVRELRVALGDIADSPRFIETLPRRGYRFIAPVVAEPDADRALASNPPAAPDDGRPPVATPPPGAGRATIRRWPWVAVAATLVALAAAATAWRSGADDLAITGTSLVVRPFTGSGDERASGSGLAHAIAARLGGQRLLTIRPEGRAEVGAPGSLMLDGEIVVDDGDVTVTARLLDAVTSRMLWSDRVRVRADQFYDAEAVIAERVASALRLRLAAPEQERLRRRYTSNAAAYAAFLAGRAALVQYTPDGTRAAVDAFETALRIDPSYALARAGLAIACADQFLRFAPPGEVERWAERAESEARAALALDSDLAEAHLARAAVARKREFDWGAAIESSRRALVLNPNLPQAHLIVAAAYYHLGYMEEASIALDHGRSLGGDDVVEPERIDGLVALFSGRFAPALAHLEEVSRLSSDAIGDTYLALAYFYSGSPDRGRAMLESLAEHRSASTAARAGAALAGVLAALGETTRANEQLQQVLAGKYRDHHVAYGVGAAYARLGDPANALQWLRVAADTGFPCAPWFDVDPLLTPLRGTTGYAALVAHVDARRRASRAPSP